LDGVRGARYAADMNILRVQVIVFGIGLSLVSAWSCSGGSDSTQADESDASASSVPDESPAAPAVPAYSGPRGAIDPATTGTIRGTIRFEGTPPPRKEMAIGNTAGCDHHPEPMLTEDVLVVDGKLENVFVSIKLGLDGWTIPPPAAPAVVLDQHGCMYRPRVSGMRVGQKLAVRNSDQATHNVHARPERNDGFNRTQPPGSPDIEWTATKPEVMVPLTCDVHPWMKAFVGVRDHPWFAVTGPDGQYALAGVPPGDYTIEAWHEKYGKKTGKVSLAPSGTAELSLSFSGK
jgi:hypothetical protein